MAKPIFLSLGIDPQVCDVVQRFLFVRMLTIPMDIVGESYQKATVAMGIISPTIVYSSCLNVGVLVLDLLFVNYLRCGFVSLAWSFVISTYVSGFVAVWYGQRFPEIRRVMILPTWEVAAEVHTNDTNGRYEIALSGRTSPL
jgi:Na+-driven multidrug efflux pump